MTRINDTAKINLVINGEQAKAELNTIKNDLEAARKRLEALQNQGADTKSVRRAQKEVDRLTQKLDNMQSQTEGVKRALQGMDSMSLRQLRQTLKALQERLAGVKEGTREWDAYAEAIGVVKGRISELNDKLKTHESLLSRAVGWFNRWQTLIVGIVAGSGSIIDAFRSSVDAFASMDQEMANVRKFTGMAEDQVKSLNDEFKKIDTRTSREDLNKLAQEAGRLGKTSQEDVLGFVRAADKINVALDDLGDGATLTLSKLTGIFGDEARYGTEQSLLKVGSVINELSQNCSASAPYLANFTERMGGVGAQAGMTIQQIMGFGAVLDSNSQKVEASATALSQVIVRMMQDPAKYAQVAGLEVENFTRLLRDDTNAALLLFLDTLQKAGGMDVLSPMFKDMGENGSRAIAALSTLATNIDQVKAQQEAANIAFAEGISIDKEFAVQNETVQASLDKAKKRIAELRVELGQKLAPLMSHIMSSGSALIRAMNIAFDFVMAHRSTIMALTAAVVAYNAVLKTRTALEAVHYGWLVACEKATKLWTAAMAPMRLAVFAWNNGIAAATRALRMHKVALASTGWGIAAVAIGAVTGALVKYASRVNEVKEANKRLAETTESVRSETDKEIGQVKSLFEKLSSAKKGTDEYEQTKSTIINQYGEYLKGLGKEIESLENVAAAYDAITRAARDSAKARGLAEATKAADDTFNSTLSEKSKDIGTALSGVEITELVGNSKSKRKLSAREKAQLQRSIVGAAESGDFSDTLLQQLKSIGVWRSKGGAFSGKGDGADIAEAINDIIKAAQTRSYEYEQADMTFGTAQSDFAGLDYNQLTVALDQLKSLLQSGAIDSRNGSSINLPNGKKLTFFSSAEVQNEIPDLQRLIEKALDSMEGYTVVGGSAVKAPETTDDEEPERSGKDKFAKEKAWREGTQAETRIAYEQGLLLHSEYTAKMAEIDRDYNQKLLERKDLTADERLKINADYWTALNDADRKKAGVSLEVAKNQADEEVRNYEDLLARFRRNHLQRLNDEVTSDEDRQREADYYNELLEMAELDHLQRMAAIYADGSDEQLDAQRKYDEAQIAARERRIKADEASKRKNVSLSSSIKDRFFGKNQSEKDEEYAVQKSALDAVYAAELAAAEGNEAEILRIKEAYLAAELALRKQYNQEGAADAQSSYDKAIAASVEWLKGEGGQALTGSLSAVISGMSSIFSGLSSMVQAELEIQTSKIEQRYDREVEIAQGNSYKVAQLEKKKEKEIARAKNEANRKMFAMQVIQAVAQTAQNAISAYGSAAAIPVVGHILAPIAAAAAVAAGTIQIAAIKKQQQAAEAQGYSKGGFTRRGRVDEPAGIVHAGEWVASQKLLANPVARPMIDALDYAQRTNTIGSLKADDVSRSITAGNSIARIVESDEGSALMMAVASRMAAAVDSLTNRLNEPFVTVNTVTGDAGIKQAQDDYSRLINNVTPKRKRK